MFSLIFDNCSHNCNIINDWKIKTLDFTAVAVLSELPSIDNIYYTVKNDTDDVDELPFTSSTMDIVIQKSLLHAGTNLTPTEWM